MAQKMGHCNALIATPGNRKLRAVVGPDGRWYPSIASAARATHTPATTIKSRLILPKPGDWRYATAEDVRRHEAEIDDAAAPSAG